MLIKASNSIVPPVGLHSSVEQREDLIRSRERIVFGSRFAGPVRTPIGSVHFPSKFVQLQHCVESSFQWLNFHVLEFRFVLFQPQRSKCRVAITT